MGYLYGRIFKAVPYSFELAAALADKVAPQVLNDVVHSRCRPSNLLKSNERKA
jgi:hypothetical protein